MEQQTTTGLKQLFQSLCPQASNLIEGIVTCVSPLQVTLVNDAKMVLGIHSLVLPQHLTDYNLKVTLLEQTGSQTDITVHNSLKCGEHVYLFPFHNGKKFYILDRKGK